MKYVPTGEWTIHRYKEKIIPIANSDDKRQITAVLAITLTGDFLPPQMIYQGKMPRCHPKVAFPEEWYSANHWSTEETMIRYLEKVIVPFVSHKREVLKLDKDRPALAIFDSFKGQTTPAFYSLLQSHNIIAVQVPANCTDKLQPLHVSLNKLVKDEMKKRFQTWYSEQVQKQLQERVPINQVKIEMPTSVMKNLSANWIMSTWESLKSRSEMAVNGFRKAGILSAIDLIMD